MTYNRDVLIDVLVYHTRNDITSCWCGWAELGRSWPGHVADAYEEAASIQDRYNNSPELRNVLSKAAASPSVRRPRRPRRVHGEN